MFLPGCRCGHLAPD